MDMNAAYNAVVKEFNPKIGIVYDKFHLLKKYNHEVLDSIRISTHKEIKDRLENKKQESDKDKKDVDVIENNEEREKFSAEELTHMKNSIKSVRTSLSKNGECSVNEKTKVYEYKDKNQTGVLPPVLNEFKSLAEAEAYAYKEKMVTIYSSDLTPKRAEEEWIKVLAEMSNSEIKKIADFEDNMLGKVDGIAAYAKHKITIGPLEWMNNKIKVSKIIGFGYRNNSYFFKLIRYRTLAEEYRNLLSS